MHRLTNTGQGLNRVQPADNVGRAMRQILARCQQQIGGWVCTLYSFSVTVMTCGDFACLLF